MTKKSIIPIIAITTLLLLTGCDDTNSSKDYQKGTLYDKQTQTSTEATDTTTQDVQEQTTATVPLPSGNKGTYTDNKTTFNYPENWNVNNKYGLTVIESNDPNYEHVKITYYSNKDKKYDIEDYASLPDAITTDIGRTYINLDDMKEDELETILTVVDMNMLKIDGIDVFYFKINCNLKPKTQRVIKALPGTSGLYMYAYCYNNSEGIPTTVIISGLIAEDEQLAIINSTLNLKLN